MMTQEYPDAPLVLIKGGILPEGYQKMFSKPEVLDMATQLGLGEDIALNAAWNIRGKVLTIACNPVMMVFVGLLLLLLLLLLLISACCCYWC